MSRLRHRPGYLLAWLMLAIAMVSYLMLRQADRSLMRLSETRLAHFENAAYAMARGGVEAALTGEEDLAIEYHIEGATASLRLDPSESGILSCGIVRATHRLPGRNQVTYCIEVSRRDGAPVAWREFRPD